MTLLEIKSKVYALEMTMGELYILLNISRQQFYRKIKKQDKEFIKLLNKTLKK